MNALTGPGELLLRAQQLKALDRPAQRDYRSVLHFMEIDGGPLPRKESRFVYEKEDLITLRPGQDRAWLDTMLERLLKVFHNPIFTVRRDDRIYLTRH